MLGNPLITFERTGHVQWLDPVQLTPASVLALGRTASAREAALTILRRLTPDDYIDFLVGYLEQGHRVLGPAWDYTDVPLVLAGLAGATQPKTYLEIGVRRGRSLAMVAVQAPTASIWGLDLWIRNYAGMDNPGPDFVRDEIHRLGHRGSLTLISGNSRETLPALLAAEPALMFDLVTVDGDHSLEGAAHDLQTVLPRIRPGGVIVFDDIAHPLHPDLMDCWQNIVEKDAAFRTATYTELGHGIAVGVRRAARE